MDIRVDWQLPPVPGIDQIVLEFTVFRGDPDSVIPLVLGPTVHLGMVNRFPVPLPASYSLSRFLALRPYYRDPANPFVRTPYVPQPGDVFQVIGACGIFTAAPNPDRPGTWILTQQGSRSTASAGLFLPGDDANGNPLVPWPDNPPAFIEPQSADPGETLPPLQSVTLTLIP